MTNTVKELTNQLKKVTQEHLFFGNNNQFTFENLEKTKPMQDEIERLRKLIKKETKLHKWSTTNIGRRLKH